MKNIFILVNLTNFSSYLLGGMKVTVDGGPVDGGPVDGRPVDLALPEM